VLKSEVAITHDADAVDIAITVEHNAGGPPLAMAGLHGRITLR
jgi:hypothetical protein